MPQDGGLTEEFQAGKQGKLGNHAHLPAHPHPRFCFENKACEDEHEDEHESMNQPEFFAWQNYYSAYKEGVL